MDMPLPLLMANFQAPPELDGEGKPIVNTQPLNETNNKAIEEQASKGEV